MMQRELQIKSTLDESLQPSLFYGAESTEKRPLLVGLHTWGANRFNHVDRMVPYAEKYNFNLLLPEFRGRNRVENPNCTEACGSIYAKQDIIDAVDYCVANENVDADNVFLLGPSGGGHMALLMAGYRPEYFKAIGAFVSITDLKRWSEENLNYTKDIFACCSNDEEEMAKRSPINYIDTIAKSNLKIFHGKSDPSVPVGHSIRLFNAINEKHPKARVYLDIFDGGHTIDMDQAFYWFMSQYNRVEKENVTG